jgi:ribonuclease HI
MDNATSAEAAALLQGLQLVDRIGCSPIIIESDSLEIVQAFKGEIEIRGPYHAILSDCFQVASRIEPFSIQHCLREANMVAHKLARTCFDSNNSIFWGCDPPNFIIADVIKDVTLLTHL